MLTIKSFKPKNSIVSGIKPKVIVNKNLSNRLYPVTLRKGSPMGLLLSLTYNADQSILSPKSS